MVFDVVGGGWVLGRVPARASGPTCRLAFWRVASPPHQAPHLAGCVPWPPSPAPRASHPASPPATAARHPCMRWRRSGGRTLQVQRRPPPLPAAQRRRMRSDSVPPPSPLPPLAAADLVMNMILALMVRPSRRHLPAPPLPLLTAAAAAIAVQRVLPSNACCFVPPTRPAHPQVLFKIIPIKTALQGFGNSGLMTVVTLFMVAQASCTSVIVGAVVLVLQSIRCTHVPFFPLGAASPTAPPPTSPPTPPPSTHLRPPTHPPPSPPPPPPPFHAGHHLHRRRRLAGDQAAGRAEGHDAGSGGGRRRKQATACCTTA